MCFPFRRRRQYHHPTNAAAMAPPRIKKYRFTRELSVELSVASLSEVLPSPSLVGEGYIVGDCEDELAGKLAEPLAERTVDD